MRRNRLRGATMALYAAFIVLVGIPLLALTVDITRAYLANVRLRNATEAACLAYVRSLDTKRFIKTGETKISSSASGNAWEVFLPTAPEGSTLEVATSEKDGRVVAFCRGRKTLPALILIFPSYELSTSTAAKADFANAGNW